MFKRVAGGMILVLMGIGGFGTSIDYLKAFCNDAVFVCQSHVTSIGLVCSFGAAILITALGIFIIVDCAKE